MHSAYPYEKPYGQYERPPYEQPYRQPYEQPYEDPYGQPYGQPYEHPHEQPYGQTFFQDVPHKQPQPEKMPDLENHTHDYVLTPDVVGRCVTCEGSPPHPTDFYVCSLCLELLCIPCHTSMLDTPNYVLSYLRKYYSHVTDRKDIDTLVAIFKEYPPDKLCLRTGEEHDEVMKLLRTS
eukprot:CAMPEP_0174257026 /NCGR_PEP_ID=MMETSP0439-20130205/6206_1 /TAXON_ID=0 /ORGANISM="Stereomyxa ramosa, Strain Chinc5" /LENGTH=177 /DNA_ID=CAMNT_0015339925 /DNA_START=1309 /DNA_END=1842 /DNA_ORIENTATION=-